MPIYRGVGGTPMASTPAEVALVAQLTADAQAAAATATSAAASASASSTLATSSSNVAVVKATEAEGYASIASDAKDAVLAVSSYQPTAVLEAIKQVDGASSGLDADTVDGFQSSVLTKHVDNVSSLLSAQTIGAVNVLNYHDGLEGGGGGVFYWDATGDATEHNGGTVISPLATFPTDWNNQTQLTTWFDGSALVGTGVWRRQYAGAVNVKWFGAKGDGVSDDTTPIEKVMLTYTLNNVLFNDGVFYSQILLDNREFVKLRGNGTLVYLGGKVNLKVSKIHNKPLQYRTVSVSIDDRDDGDVGIDYDFWADHLKIQNADAVLCVATNMPSADASVFTRLPEEKILSMITKLKNNDVQVVMLKPHIVVGWDDSFVRSNVNPLNVDTHMTNWGVELAYYAGLCDQNNIPFLCLTCEQPNQTGPSVQPYWEIIVSNIKALYPRLKLTSAFTYTESKNNLSYIEQGQKSLQHLLDSYGQNVYPSYTNVLYEEVGDLATPNIDYRDVGRGFYNSSFGGYYNDLNEGVKFVDITSKLSKILNIPVFVTEVGCMNSTDALVSVVPPYRPSAPSTRTYKTQAILIEAVMVYLAGLPFIEGVSWWNVLGPFDYFEDNVTTEAEAMFIKYFKGDIV